MTNSNSNNNSNRFSDLDLDFWVLFMTVLALSLACAVFVIVVIHYANGITYSEMLIMYADNPPPPTPPLSSHPNDPDFNLYSKNPGAYSGEIKQYIDNDLIISNHTTYPNATGDLKPAICCKQFPE